MRAVSFNLHMGAGGLDAAAEAIAELEPELVFLQSVDRGTKRAHRADQADALGKKLGMHALFAPAYSIDEGEHGLAILSSGPLQAMRIVGLPHEQPHDPRTPRGDDHRYEATILLIAKHGHLTVACTHLGFGESERKSQANVVIAGLLDDDDVLLGAEMNEGPGGGAVKRLADDFVDAFASVGGDEASTNPDDRSGWRTQFLFTGGALQPVKGRIGRAVGPGFRPLLVEVA